VAWIKRFILFHGKRHPAEMGEPEINRFLTDLAVHRKVSASTQNQALSALLFLYQHVLNQPIDWVNPAVRAQRPERLPVVLTKPEVKAILDRMDGSPQLIATLLYGAGLRLTECLQFRVKDIDFTANQMVVRDGKGQKDRLTMLPAMVKEPLTAHLNRVRQLHQQDLGEGFCKLRHCYSLVRAPQARVHDSAVWWFASRRRDVRLSLIRRTPLCLASAHSGSGLHVHASEFSLVDGCGEMLSEMRPMRPNHALQRTAASRSCSNRRASWPPSLSLGRWTDKGWNATRPHSINRTPLTLFCGLWACCETSACRSRSRVG
jgi:integrase